jgi:predicted PurR-regulated permease PerM
MSARRITPGARARRALLFDSIAAVALAVLVLSLAAGLGVVAFFALPLFLVGLLWIGIERLVRRLRRRRLRVAR